MADRKFIRPFSKEQVDALDVVTRIELEEMGIITPKTRSLFGRFKATLLAVAGRIKWFLFGKRRHEKQLEIQAARMKQLAGIGTDSYVIKPEPYSKAFERITASREHLDSIDGDHFRKLIEERQPLPKPDYDDSGLN